MRRRCRHVRRARSRVHPPAHTCMAACWAHHQRPSVGTGILGRTALPSSRACSGIEAMACLATPRQRVVDRSCITFHMKSFLEADPILATYSAISFSKAKASRPTQTYVSQAHNATSEAAHSSTYMTRSSDEVTHPSGWALFPTHKHRCADERGG